LYKFAYQCIYFRKAPKPSPKAAKQPRTWPLGGNVKDISTLDYTKDKPNNNADSQTEIETNIEVNQHSS